MLKHYDFVPFGIMDLPVGSSLVFAPHPDDETFGLGGSILKLTDKGQKVDVIMMTDGAAGGNAEVRKAELLEASALLSINQCYFFGAPDGDLAVNTANTKAVLDLIEQYSPDNIFFPSPFEYHPDHRATAWLVWNALQSMDFTGNVFSYEIANQSPINMLVDITVEIQRKTEIMELYASQNAQMDYVDTITAINRTRAYTASSDSVKYAEAFFAFPDISMDLMSYYYQKLHTYHRGVTTEKLPLVSVLVRTKNRPDRLKYALESIVRQIYQQIEVNIVNDGGEDIQHVVDTFDFERIFVKTHESSRGRAATANALLKMVQGKYCIFLDDDDTFDSDHIENLVGVMRENENMLACYSGIRVGNNLAGRPPFNQRYNAALLRRGNYIPFHAVLFSSKLIEDGCQFDESLDVYEDWDFWLQVAQRTEFYHYNKITATYNINGQSGAGGAGAGGNASKEINVEMNIMNIYEKWAKIWSSRQLYQTFHALANLNMGQIQETQKHLQTMKQEQSEILQEKEKSIIQLQVEIEQLKKHSKNLQHQINIQDKDRIKEYSNSDLTKRDFELVSARNYEAQCITLFEEVFKEKMSKEFWNWKYRGVKWRGICALKDGKVVAHYNGMPRDILYFGKWKRVLQPCDIMVSPKARGGIKQNSPFYTTVKVWSLSNLGVDKEFAFSYGFPNKRHSDLSEKLGVTTEVDTITELHWKCTETETPTDYSLETYIESVELDKEIKKIWQGMASDFKDAIIGVRNDKTLKFRYLKHPKFNYHLYIIRDTSLKAISLFVLKQEGKIILLMDIVAKKEHFKTTIKAALNIAQEIDCHSMKCWTTTSKVDLYNHYTPEIVDPKVSIPTTSMVPGSDPKSIKNKWFLMYGDTDFI